MSIKLNAQSGGSVALDAPTQTTSSADLTFKLPIADGSAGQVLKTDGSGNLSWVTLPTDNNTWVKQHTITVTSNVTDVQFQNSMSEVDFSTYKTYALLMTGVRPEADDYTLRYRIYDSSGEFSSSEYKTKLNTDQGNYNLGGQSSGHFTYNGIGNNTSGSLIYEDYHTIAYMHGFAANRRFNIHGQSSFLDNSSDIRNQVYASGVNLETETTGIKIFSSGGQIALGTFTLYGLVT